MKLTEQKLREIIREELKSTGKVDEIAPLVAMAARQAAASAIASKVSEKYNEGLVPEPKELVNLISASAEVYHADDDDSHTSEGFMGAAKELVENALAKIATEVATDAAKDAIAKKVAAKAGK